ncbi:MAG TPA: hypothetical protein VGG73_14115 [Vicinamibacterales bacterium]|jgi:hypothetical protein
MKSQGSVYVAVVFAALVGYFTYQWWFNPTRDVKRRLGDVAESLSMLPDEKDMDRLARLAKLRRYLATDVHVRIGTAPEITSRDMALGVVSGVRPPAGGWDIAFADVQIVMESKTTAHAFVSVEITTRDAQDQPSIDSRDASINLARQDGEWVVTRAEATEIPIAR